MADVPQYTTVARPKDYWMSPRALSITLNARSEANRIAASASSGAQFFCHFEDIGDAQAEEMFGYDVGHNFRSWPLAISPTYFNTNNVIYPHIAIPRTDRGDSLAMVVFPTVVLDLWGYETETEPMQDEDGNYIDEYGNIVETAAEAATGYVRKKKSGTETDADPVGSEEYYYIYLHGKLLAPFYRSGSLVRDWDHEIDTGRLNTDETWGEVITLEQLAREMKKKVDVEWFQRIFTIHGTGKKRVPTEWDDDGKPIEWETDDEGNIIYEGDDGERRDIKPNDMDHEITDTESMFGTWTEKWLSALGIGSGSGGSGGGGGGDALDEPLLSINQMVATPTTAGQTLVWKGIGLGINGSGWDFDTAGMSQQEIQTLFDSRYLKLTSQSPQSVTSDITLNGLLTINHAQGFDPTSDQVGNNVVLTKGETLTLLDGRYVTVAFWNSLFETYNGNSPVNVNTENPIINNLKILVGTWTESYVSALGIGSGGSGGGGVWYLSQLEDVDHNSTPSNGDALVWDGQQWTFDTAGLNENELGQYLSTNKYVKADSNTKWWGRTMNNGVVKGDIDMTLGDSIGWSLTGTSSPLSMVTLKTESSDRLFILGEGTTVNNNRIPTYLRGSSIYFQTVSGNIDASLTIPASGDAIFYVKKLQIGSIVISEDTTNHAIHVEQNGIYADTYVSALGTGSGGGGGTPLNTLLMSLNDTSLSPTSTGYTNAVLVNTNGAWSWKDYGGGSVTNLKTLTVKGGTTNAVVYNPADTQATTLTVSGQKVNNTDVLTVTADGTAHTLTIALADNYGDTKNPYAAKSAHYVLAGPASGNATVPEFRQLAPSDISNLSLDAQTGLITIGSNTITPLTDATLKNDYEWWGGKLDATTKKREGDMSNVGNIKIDNDAKISWKKAGASNYLSMLTLDTSNNFIVGESMASSGYTTYLRGRSITFQTGTSNSGNHTASMSNAGLFTVEKLKIGSIVISEDTQNGGLHVESAGIYADTYVSSLGTGSGGGGGTPLNSLLMSLNDASGVQNPTSVSNKVLVNNRGTWSWETYGGGGSGTIGGASDKADYFTGYVANSAAKLSPGKKINGTTFTGESDITTDKWGTARTITIKDNDATNQQANTDIDGSADFILKLPATIKASLTGTASKATRLASDDTKSAWGVTYWSGGKPQAISGNMTDVGNISFSASGKNIGGVAYFDTTNTRLGIGAAPGAYALDVSGDIHTSGDSYIDSGKALICKISSSSTKKLLEFDGTQVTLGYGFRSSNETRIYGKNIGMYYGTTLKVQVTTDGLKIGDITIKNENGGLHVIGGGLYTDTFLSALGIGSGGGSGSGITMNDVWSALAVAAPNGSSEQINLTHMTLALSTYAKTADVTKKLTIHQEGQDDIEYNGTAAREITISAGGFEMKSVTNATLKGLSGTFGFYGQNLPDGDTRNYDWVGIQVGTTNDKWQLMADSGHLMIRQNDAGGNSSTGWVPVSSVESSGWYTVLDSGNYKSVIGNTYSTEDTKNTAGNIDIYGVNGAATELYLVGAGSNSGSYSVTYINSSCYIGTDNCLYSGGEKTVTYKNVGDNDLTGYGGSFFFGGGETLASGEDYVGFQAGNNNDRWQMAYFQGNIKWRENDTAGSPTTGWTAWRTVVDSNNVGTYLSGSYVDRSTDQSIEGTKTFLSGITMVSDIKPNSHQQYYVGTSSNAFYEMNSYRYNTVPSNGYFHRFGTNSSGNGGLAICSTDGTLHTYFVWANNKKEVILGSASFNANTYIYGNHVGIGTSSPGDYKLYVDGTGYFNSTLRINSGIEAPNGDGLLVYAPASGWTGISSSQWGVGCVSKQGVIRSSSSNLLHYKGSASYAILDASNARNYCIGLQGIDYDGAVNLPSGQNLNNILAAGTYCCQSGSVAQSQTNVPYASGNYRLWHIVNTGDDNSSSNQYSAQIVLAPNEGRMFIRSHNKNSFGAWKEFMTSGNVVTLDTTQDISGAKSFTSDIRCKKSNASIYVCQMSGASEIKKVGLNSDNNRGVWDYSYGAWLIGNNGTSTFLNVGNVGIGTTSPFAKLHVDGSGYFSNAINIAGIDQYHALYVNGDTKLGGLVGIGASAKSGYNLYVDGKTNINGDVDITKGKTIYFQHGANGVPEISIGTGTGSNDQNLYLKGINLYFNSSIISSSDMRLKDVDELVDGDIESIARAPIFYYRWKKTPEFGLHLGSSAQYWQNVFSCAVIKDEEGYLGLDYSATALASAVITARKVLDHEGEIKALKKRIGELEQEIETLKAA